VTVYPGGTDTPMMQTNRAGPELGFGRDPASAVADATMEGIETDAFEVIRGGETRAQMIALNPLIEGVYRGAGRRAEPWWLRSSE
jgi:uncharacterized oxidoreductase